MKTKQDRQNDLVLAMIAYSETPNGIGSMDLDKIVDSFKLHYKSNTTNTNCPIKNFEALMDLYKAQQNI